MVEIKRLNKEQLLQFVGKDEFYNLEFVPITVHRAISHGNNPRAEKDDALLFLAYKEGGVCGYLGVLPDTIFIGNSESKLGWLSCLWVSPKHRGLQIAQKLLSAAFEAWDDKIAVTEFTPEAGGLYNKTGRFRDLVEKTGMRLYIRSDLSTILPPKHTVFKKTQGVLRLFDRLVNTFLDLRFLLKKEPVVFIELDQEIDRECEEFINKHLGESTFRRGLMDIKWIIQYPWVLSAREKDSIGKKYHFSSSDRLFQFHTVKVKNKENKLIGFLVLARRNETLKIPYLFMEAGSEQDVIKAINQLVLIWKVSTLTVYHKALVEYFSKHKTIALHKKEIKRKYIISDVFESQISKEEINIQDGDADCSFT